MKAEKMKAKPKERNEEAPDRSSRESVAAPPSVVCVPHGAFGPAALQHAAGNLAIQRAAKTSRPSAADSLSRRIRGASGGGTRLDRAIRRRLEQGLGANLQNVRVHADGEADQLAQAVNAVAFTSGQHIFFREGAYDPSSEDGLRLLAHETAHVAQQMTGPVAGTLAPGGVSLSDPADRFEQAAVRAAYDVIAGTPPRSVERRGDEASHANRHDAERRAGTASPPAMPSPATSMPAIQRQGPKIPPNINPYGPTEPILPEGPTPLAPEIPGNPPPPSIPKAPPVPNIPEPPPGGFPKLPPSPATGAAAGEAAAVDLAGVATSAAAVIIPLAAAVVIGYGLFQASKLTEAAVAAANAGVEARRRARTAASGFAHVMTGGKSKGDEGSTEAERQILAIMAKTNASREQVVEAITSQQGGYSAIYQKNLKRMQDHLYAEAVRTFEETHQEDFGIIESFGEDWGMRGRFRKDLRLVLYAED